MTVCDLIVALHNLNYSFHSLNYSFHSLNSQCFQRHYLTSSQSDKAVDHYQQNCMMMIDFKIAIHSLTVHIDMKTD